MNNQRDIIVDFGANDRSEWRIINDGVMGGLSLSNMRRRENGYGIFTGVLSLENNGGFASARTSIGQTNLSAHAGLEIRVRGDGRTYQLRLRTDNRSDGIAYRSTFVTSAGEWITARIPFEDFIPTFRGRTLSDVPPLDPSRIEQLAFMIADKQPGSFSLEIDFVRTW